MAIAIEGREHALPVCLTALLWFAVVSASASADTESTNAFVEDARCRIEFDAQGGLKRIYNQTLNDDCLKSGHAGGMPFRLYADPTGEFTISINEKFQLVFEEPQATTKKRIQPDTCRLVDMNQESGLSLRYECDGFGILLRVAFTDEPGVSDWSLRVTNTGDSPREFLASFPCFDGIRIGPEPARDLATAMDQAGLVVPVWDRPGGVFGESNQLSMQWHAVWDPVTKSALGLIFMDAEARPKRLILAEPSLEMLYFPPIRLEPGASVDLPRVRVLVYEGDWRRAARAYRAWYDHAYAHLKPPEWFRKSDGEIGAHFKRRGLAGERYAGQHVIDSWRELPARQLRYPIDAWEYAFYGRTSMLDDDKPYTPHTDGDNIIREDLGGAKAMREGIAGVHRLGLHSILYVEGYIVHEHSELARSGLAKRWAVMYKDGSLRGSYSTQGFYHMCAGCVEWQDHLAEMVARLLAETDADGVRLDSLGFYYLPCYNPAHGHETPFGYNEWLKQLLTKVRNAAVAVKPDVLLLTEGPADWLGPYVHGALSSRCPRELSPMRVAVGPFRPYVYASGAVWASLSGFAGAGAGSDVHSPEWNWACAQAPVHEALVWGDVRDDPVASDAEIVSRCFETDGYFVVVAARPACGDPIWPRGTGLSPRHAPYTLTVADIAGSVVDSALCDVETLDWRSLPFERVAEGIRVTLESNWVLVVLRKPGGPSLVSFPPLPVLAEGGSAKVEPTCLTGTDMHSLSTEVFAPGLETPTVASPTPTGALTVRVPLGVLPGHYAVQVRGPGVLGIKRFLTVEGPARPALVHDESSNGSKGP